ncbi:MAG TPA: AzlD domain-containing protein [Hyphomicrobiales bacterium]|nr:AzlD domain-containing protein [Kaistiaceae bacterium]HQF31119.1 AzlD domain-containing protein [Hyphomicrobiales bacterium]
MNTGFWSLDATWWPYVFILVAGWLATDIWRFLGVFLSDRLTEESEALIFVRSVATALVAGVIAKLIVFPGGALAAAPMALPLAAVAAGMGFFWGVRRNLFLAILAAEAVLVGGSLLL